MEINCKRIREIRRQRELSQEYVAFMLGISQSQYSKLENENKIFELDKLSKLFDVLEINPLEVIEFSEKKRFLIDKKSEFRILTNQEIKNIDGGFSFALGQKWGFYGKYF